MPCFDKSDESLVRRSVRSQHGPRTCQVANTAFVLHNGSVSNGHKLKEIIKIGKRGRRGEEKRQGVDALRGNWV